MGEKGNYNNDGRVAVITGSSKGIGKAIAMEFARAGYSIVMNARHEQQLKQAAEEISNSIEDEEKIVSLAGDISQEHICVSLVEKAVRQFGKIDVMINNAGIGGESKKIHELTEKDWDEVIDINLKGAFFCTREAEKNMVSRLGNERNADNKKTIIVQLLIFRRYTNRLLTPSQLNMQLQRAAWKC
mgnify:CR=1 FL=1